MKANEAKMLAVLFEAQVPFLGNSWMNAMIKGLLVLRRLAIKHNRLAEMDCNGEGVIRRDHYYSGTIDDTHAHMVYGPSTKSAYTEMVDEYGNRRTIFDVESDKIEDKIKAIAERLGLRVEFQGDPRGYTVKVFKGDRFLDIQG